MLSEAAHASSGLRSGLHCEKKLPLVRVLAVDTSQLAIENAPQGTSMAAESILCSFRTWTDSQPIFGKLLPCAVNPFVPRDPQRGGRAELGFQISQLLSL